MAAAAMELARRLGARALAALLLIVPAGLAFASERIAEPLERAAEADRASIAETEWRARISEAFAVEIVVDASGRTPGSVQSLQAALDMAPSGAALRLLPGRYQGPFEVSQRLQILGDGDPADIVIEGLDADALRWTAPSGRIQGVTLRMRKSAELTEAPYGALDIVGGALLAEDVILSSEGGPAVHVRDGANALFRAPRALPGGATAMSIYGGGRATVSDPRFGGHRGAAIELFNDGELRLSGGVIEGGSGGVFAVDHARLEIENTRFERVAGAAIALARGAVGRLTGVVVREAGDVGLLVGRDALLAAIDTEVSSARLAAVEARNGARVALRRCRIENGGQGGVLVRAGSALRMERSVVRGSRLAGVEVRSGARAVLERNRIVESAASGVYVHEKGVAQLLDNEIRDNARAGVEIASGGKARLTGGEVDANGLDPILARDGGVFERAEIEEAKDVPTR